jgi:hypothetical protein
MIRLETLESRRLQWSTFLVRAPKQASEALPEKQARTTPALVMDTCLSRPLQGRKMETGTICANFK